jgi:hypothetical protein
MGIMILSRLLDEDYLRDQALEAYRKCKLFKNPRNIVLRQYNSETTTRLVAIYTSTYVCKINTM